MTPDILVDSLKEQPLGFAKQLRILGERMYVSLGWSGLTGIVLCTVSAISFAWLTSVQQGVSRNEVNAGSSIGDVAPTPVVSSSRLVPPSLPRSRDTVDLIKRIKVAIRSQGLAWPQAEYRTAPLSDDTLAALEIRTTLKGTYPQIRAVVTSLLKTEPALALRELTLTRPNSDASEVEAKIRWVVFLADNWPPANFGGQQ